ncbi:haloacid dehalogenase type II [Rhodospirillaceae bacterium KN72]|uniref:(S)-2-haloacid dehalogenase n=1 Tax=Pacificispira spongiicola TaxID=2729598 RepID=A0A7Y0DZ19_9PROT|nr:haloacid dehalogenase type II [Pacificispira spongiicola]NMM44190.1 haloacid dehalogenase type II [Pacificispira spongiicola]
MTGLTGVRACVFDAYGTLFDVHSAANALKADIGPEADRLSMLWRDKQVGYSWLLSLMGDAYKPFWEVTQDALDYAMEATGLADRKDLRQRLLDLYFTLAAYPEVPGMLAGLKAKGLSTAILSNGSPDMLNGAVSSANVGGVLDAVLSVEDVGIFKPAPSVYQLVMDRFGLTKRDEVLFMSSNGWDAAAASHFGFRVVWINRSGLPLERLPGTPVAIKNDLTGLADMIDV